MPQTLHDDDRITMTLLGRKTELTVLLTGESRFDEDGGDREGGPLNEAETALVGWLTEEVDLSGLPSALTAYCNQLYQGTGRPQITEADLESEVSLTHIALNLGGVCQSLDGGLVYPDIALLGECACDPEHGLCAGFRDRNFLGIGLQDWIL